MDPAVRDHYNTFLAGSYVWISGGMEEQVRRNREFFAGHVPVPRNNHGAIDLGAGCGYQSIALADLGYTVTAVDFSGALLEELRQHAGNLPVETIEGDLREYSRWSGRRPALITCMGDTLPHLSSPAEAEDLIRHCFRELDSGGKLVLSLRDYSREQAGEIVLIPVQRDRDRIFLCRLEYLPGTVVVRDILYSRRTGLWKRTAGQYIKIRLAPDVLARMLTGAGFVVEDLSAEEEMIVCIARKEA